jgi:negative regulator of flagellin synthesis FlgM
MIRDISGLGSPNRNELRTDRNIADGAKAEKNATEVTATAVKSTSSDQVELSDQLQTLKALEGQLASLPDVDEERVAAIKSAIESGQYTIDNAQVADKILSADTLFGK